MLPNDPMDSTRLKRLFPAVKAPKRCQVWVEQARSCKPLLSIPILELA